MGERESLLSLIYTAKQVLWIIGLGGYHICRADRGPSAFHLDHQLPSKVQPASKLSPN